MKARRLSFLSLSLGLGVCVLLGCRSGDESGPEMISPEVEATAGDLQSLDADRQREAQLASLRQVYSRDTPAPPSPTPDELSGVAGVLEAGPEEERAYLEEYYRQDKDLLVFATRDSDGDGVRDYRVSDYYGKFLEGDIDVDEDGVRNLYDAAPYDSSVGGQDSDGDGIPDAPGSFLDANSNAIPDHLDWGQQGKSHETVARQAELFRDHKILLVERSAPFTDELARTVYDAITRVFREPLREHSVLPTLRTIATEDTVLLTPEVDDGTNGMAIVQNQSLVIYQIGIDYPPFVQLGLVAHELGHNYQYSLDFDDGDLAAENARFYFPAPRFHALVEPFGWLAEPLDVDPVADNYQLFTPQYYELTPFYTWVEETPAEWTDWLEAIYEEVGEGYLEDERVTEWGIVGDYSLTNPWEWYSDNMIAYLFTEIEQRMHDRLSGEELQSTLRAMDEAISVAWPAFRYQNIDREVVYPHFAQTFPLREEDLDYFIEQYVVPLRTRP